MTKNIQVVITTDSAGGIAGLKAYETELDALNSKGGKSLTQFGDTSESSLTRFSNAVEKADDYNRVFQQALQTFTTVGAVIEVEALSSAIGGLVAAAVESVSAIYALPAAVAGSLGVIAGFKGAFSGIAGAVGAIDTANKAAAGSAATLQSQLAGFDKVNVLPPSTSASSAAAAQTALNALAPAGQQVAIVLAQIGKAFQDDIVKPLQQAALQGIAAQILTAYTAIEPVVSTASLKIGTAINGMLSAALTAAQSPAFANIISVVGDLSSSMITTFDPAIQSIIDILSKLITAGAPFIIQFEGYIVGLLKSFDDTSSVQGFTNSIQNGVDALKAFGGIIGAIGNVVGGVFDAMSKSGYSVLTTVSNIINEFGDWLKTAQGQAVLAGLIDLSTKALNGLATALQFVGGFIVQLITWYQTLSPATQDLIGKFAGFAVVLSPIVGFVGKIGSLVVGLVSGFDTITGAVGASGIGITEVLGNIGKFFIASPLGLAITIFTGMFAASEQFRNSIGQLLGVLGGTLTQVVSALSPLFSALGQVFGVLGNLVGTLIIALMPLITTVLNLLAPILTVLVNIFIDLLKPITQLIGAILPPLIALITALLPVITPIVTILGDVLTPVLTILGDIITVVATIIVDILIVAFNILGALITGVIIPVIQGIAGFFTGILIPAVISVGQFFGSVFAAIGGFAVGLWNNIVNALSGVGSFFQNIFNGAVGFITSAFSGIGSFIGGVFKTAFNGAADILQGFINNAIGVINGLINAINGVTSKVGIPAIPKIPLASLPHLAQGGIINSATVALVGESGAEAVMPLENNTGWIDQLASKIAVAGGATSESGQPLQVNLSLDGQKLGQIIINNINDRTKMTGRNQILV